MSSISWHSVISSIVSFSICPTSWCSSSSWLQDSYLLINLQISLMDGEKPEIFSFLGRLSCFWGSFSTLSFLFSPYPSCSLISRSSTHSLFLLHGEWGLELVSASLPSSCMVWGTKLLKWWTKWWKSSRSKSSPFFQPIKSLKSTGQFWISCWSVTRARARCYFTYGSDKDGTNFIFSGNLQKIARETQHTDQDDTHLSDPLSPLSIQNITLR